MAKLKKFSELPDREEVNPLPPLDTCRIVATHGTGEDGRNFNIPVSEVMTKVEQVYDPTSPNAMSGKAVAVAMNIDPAIDFEYVHDDVFKTMWAGKQDGKIYQTFIPFGVELPVDFDEAVAKQQYVYDPVADMVTNEINGNWDTEKNAPMSNCIPYTVNHEGQDPYLAKNIHVFSWFRGNADKARNGIPYITKLEGDGVETTGNVDVYTYGPTFWWRVTNNVTVPGSDIKGQLWEICDTPKPESEGWYPWIESVRGHNEDGTPVVAPYWCHPTYMNVLGADGHFRSLPGQMPVCDRPSYTRIVDQLITPKKEGRQGGDMSTQVFAMLFFVIKYGTRDSRGSHLQNLGAMNPGMRGCTNGYYYLDENGNPTTTANFYTTATVATTGEKTVTIANDANAKRFLVGHSVSIGTNRDHWGGSGWSISGKRNVVCSYPIIAREESEDGASVKLTIDAPTVFNVAVGRHVSLDFCRTGHTDVLDATWGKVDGNRSDNEYDYNYRNQAFRIMGTEYGNGMWTLYTDTILVNQGTGKRAFYWWPKGAKRIAIESGYPTATEQVIAQMEKVSCEDYLRATTYVRDIRVDVKHAIYWPIAGCAANEHASSMKGWCMYFLSAGDNGLGSPREMLMGGSVSNPWLSGVGFVASNVDLGNANWNFGCRG